MGKRAEIIVDFQNDFRPGGSLAAEKADDALPAILSLAQEVDYVVVSRDWHPPDHCSFKENPTFEDMSWPVHCVQETTGAQIPDAIMEVADAVVSKGTDPKKEAYSAFQGTVDGTGESLTQWLAESDVDEVIVTGLVTEVCVKATALDALDAGLRTVVSVPGSASLTEEGEKKTLNFLKQKHVHISYREPRGAREATREEAISEIVDNIVQESEEAERLGNEDLSHWYTDFLLPWVNDHAAESTGPFTVSYPNFAFSGVVYHTVPEAQMTTEQTA